MRKLSFLLILSSLLMFSACGNQQGKTKKAAESKAPSVEEQYLTQDLKIKLDSLVSEMSRLSMDPVFISAQSGKVVLSEKEKMIKPTYLLPLSKAGTLVTLSQKYRATMMYRMDMAVAEIYGMPLTEYKQTIAKLIVEIDNPAFKVNLNEDTKRDLKSVQRFITNVYDEEVKNQTVHFFWDAMVAALIEDLYIVTNNIDKFLPCFNDQTASEVTYRFILVLQGIEDLTRFHPELKNLQSIIEPLKVINAINVKQLRSQLIELKGEISEAREALLK